MHNVLVDGGGILREHFKSTSVSQIRKLSTGVSPSRIEPHKSLRGKAVPETYSGATFSRILWASRPLDLPGLATTASVDITLIREEGSFGHAGDTRALEPTRTRPIDPLESN